MRNVTLAIREGEFFSLLGPSGCGKTTTLRMIAGFEVPDQGRIVLQGKDVTSVFSNRRPVNMVFQQYALFPHMSIYDNVAFGLKVKRSPSRAPRRVHEMLRVVELEGPSGALANSRAASSSASLSHVRWSTTRRRCSSTSRPRARREAAQADAARAEADPGRAGRRSSTSRTTRKRAASDRIAVMNAGRVEQIGGPREIYEHPETAFVADFIVSNALDFTIDELVGEYAVMRISEDQRVVVPVGPGARSGDSPRVAVRPERVHIGPVETRWADGGSRLEGTVADIVYLGMYTQFHVQTPAGRIVSNRVADESTTPFELGSRVAVSWESEHAPCSATVPAEAT